ncbi:MAG TPA: YaiI/YqxD family protein [Amaricoccus sp.]|uniref:YaiI/YqxD family protein n=1 Tax=Amaricoccus sp. TaxID=1872485 RepID=UPI002C0EDC35|nr:YaiI/YqxD family protein [Amaricoccus sp.]HMQ94033.1 YaiI/YqxD family protein [Amaricoccus sp.]HMR53610.1 YaiI/YqxD family protein [Amaricoccus sp.]HMR60778.1 YaiI/YqxD family protein [Amaricoccus sp.]HMU00656.1 YaiI/YqxD family protein [Amaricoccus sp.]
MIFVDADACPVRAETVKVAERHGVKVTFVTDGGLRPSAHPLVSIVVVTEGADAADKWIAARIGPGDVCVTADVPLAARCVEAGARVLAPDGQAFTPANIGARLALRDLMADLRAADPFRKGGGRPFAAADRSRFLEALERALRAST